MALRRKEEINRDLSFIRSSLAYPDPDGLQECVMRLLCNLLDEGNFLFKDGDLEMAVEMFSEGLGVSQYAIQEELEVPSALMESLHVNRATAHHSLGEYERGVSDCDHALSVCPDSHKALYMKALCLKELRRFREAYDCTTHPLLISRPDLKVSELSQELAVALGLRARKPYISAKAPQAEMAVNGTPHGTTPPLGTPHAQPASSSVVSDMSDTLDDSEMIGDDLDHLLDDFPSKQEFAETFIPAVFSGPGSASSSTQAVPYVLPAPPSRLPTVFLSPPAGQISSRNSFAGGGRRVDPSMLDTISNLPAPGLSGSAAASDVGVKLTVPDSLDSLDTLDGLDSQVTLDTLDTLDSLEPLDALDILDAQGSLYSLDALDSQVTLNNQSTLDPLDVLDSLDALGVLDSLDALDELSDSSFPSWQTCSAPAVQDISLNGLDSFPSVGSDSAGACGPLTARTSPKLSPSKKQTTTHPLAATHAFLPACSTCFPRQGKSIYSFVHKPEIQHACAGDVLLCRRTDRPSEWTRVRKLPSWTSFSGPFVLCRELLKSGDEGICKYGEKCNFAFNQLEIDVWTEERKGTLDRKLLFVPTDPTNRIIQLLLENKGIYVFLCQVCFHNRPRIISRRHRDDHRVCSNTAIQHDFDKNRCLVFMVRTHSVTYRKIRPLNQLRQLKLCPRAVRDTCGRDDDCCYAHNAMELLTWTLQQDTGVSPEQMVRVSEQQQLNSSRLKPKRTSSADGGSKTRGAAGGGGKSLNLRMKFVCGQCWRSRQVSEPDRALRFCTAKAKHTWSPQGSVLLVRSERTKWVQVRPLPHVKNFPMSYEICTQILRSGKCNFSGTCTFAHSVEEKEMWTYMKNNNMPNMQQTYDMWLLITNKNQQAEDSALMAPTAAEDKSISMPTDHAEPMDGFHCGLCGKHSNSERQWQQHISSEKHKDRLFTCDEEEEALTWSYRFPGMVFKLCPKLDAVGHDGDGCPEGVGCDFAHSPEELLEWIERRKFLQQKLAKAREDMLVMPNETDFGKFNFLLQD